MLRTAPIATLVVLSLCGPASAQRVTGSVEEGGRPVGVVFVTLLRPDGTRVGSFLSDSTGRFFFDAPGTGRYRLRAERIGHTTASVEIDVPHEGVTVRMDAPPAAIALAAIEVRRDGRCTVRPDAAAAAARIWDEARKSLELARFAATADLTFRSARFVRELDATGTAVLSERISPTITGGTRSFRPVAPEVLDAIGFISAANDSLQFFVPDAEILLSDQFLDHHCFEAAAGGADAPDQVGLRFRPVPQRRVPEIEGTLWLDARTGALLHLEYRFVQAAAIVPVGTAHGRVDFARTRAGLVYVDRWWIRMPLMADDQGRFRLTGWVEEGGVVQGIGGTAR
jgi:hypothetical protein